jgi:predicted RNase H-like HicB family nuclease
MLREFTVIVEKDSEGYFVATVPSIPGCHTQARTRDELEQRVREAIAVCLESDPRSPAALEFVGIERVTVAV